MKLIKLALSNIHSLKGPYTIPFTTGILGEAGLFVISGPTGSGKSSILDAITLALYNRIPRVSVEITSSVIEKQGLVLSQHARDCFVELEYEVNEIRYRSHWSIRYRSTGTLDDRKQELSYADTGEIISNSVKDIVDKTTEIIGLSYEQFVQSMVLAQGQFDRLLKSKKNERNKLLEEITGGSIYRTIGRAVYDRHKKIKEDEEHLTTRINEVKVLSEAQIKEYKGFIKENEPVLLKKQNDYKELQRSQNIKETIQKKKIELKNLEQQLELVDVKINKFSSQLEKLKRSEEASIFRSQIDEWKNFKKQILLSNSDLSKNQGLIQKISLEKANALSKAELLVKKELTAENILIELGEFRKEVEALLQVEAASEIEVKNERSVAQRIVERIASSGGNGFSVEDSVEKANASISEIDLEFEKEGVTIHQDLQIEIENLARKINQIQFLISAQERFDLALANHSDSKESLLRDEAKAKALMLELEGTVSKLEVKLPEFESLQKDRELKLLQRSFDDHRAHLVEGEPCPLCGASEHPLIIELQNQVEDEMEKRFKTLKELVNSLTTSKIQYESAIDILKTGISNRQKEVSKKEAELKVAKRSVTELSGKMGPIFSENREVWDTEKSNAELRSTIIKQLDAKKLLRKEIVEFIQQREVLDKSEDFLKNARDKRKSRFDEDDLSDVVQNRITAYQKAQSEFEQATIRIKELKMLIVYAEKGISQIESDLRPQIEALGFTNMQLLSEALLSDSDSSMIRKEYDSIKREELELKGALKQLSGEINEQKLLDKQVLNLEELKVIIDQLNKSVVSLNTKIIEVKKVLEVDAEQQIYFKGLTNERAAIKKDLTIWKRLNSLIGDAQGNKFANYVQELTLEQLIQYANEHLRGLTDRYQLMPPEKDNLRVADMHLGGTLRDVVTLSGGETFKLSLAMAFALSDLASQNVQIDSLFIDEGFGSLDPESLDDAIGVLEDIQSKGSKSIGIISHVGELNDRISAKIKLKPTGTGYSDLIILND